MANYVLLYRAKHCLYGVVAGYDFSNSTRIGFSHPPIIPVDHRLRSRKPVRLRASFGVISNAIRKKDH